MPLTTGRLNETRRVGGVRSAIRTEIRRAENASNPRLAGQLGAMLAEENIARAAAGQSNVNSADEDIRVNRFARRLSQIENREKARLASAPNPLTDDDNQPTPSTPGLTAPKLGDTGEPSAAGFSGDGARPSGNPGTASTGAAAQPPSGTQDPAPVAAQPAGAGGGPAVGATGVGTVPPGPTQGGGAPDVGVGAGSLAAVRSVGGTGRINGEPATVATGAAAYRADRDVALARKEPFEFDDENPAYRARVAQVGEEAAEAEVSAERRAYYQEFEDTHGEDALMELLSRRADEATANAEARRVERQERAGRDLAGLRIAAPDVAALQEGFERQGRHVATARRLVEGATTGFAGLGARVVDVGQAAGNVGRAVVGGLREVAAVPRPDEIALRDPRSRARAEGDPAYPQFRDPDGVRDLVQDRLAEREARLREVAADYPRFEEEATRLESEYQEALRSAGRYNINTRRLRRESGVLRQQLDAARPLYEDISRLPAQREAAKGSASKRVSRALRDFRDVVLRGADPDNQEFWNQVTDEL